LVANNIPKKGLSRLEVKRKFNYLWMHAGGDNQESGFS